MSFYTSLSGLQASQTDMSVISHNLANVGTNGFKKSRAEFADVMAANFSTDPFKQVGSGTVVKANRQEFKEGNYTSTSNALDLAISGDGFFTVQAGGTTGTLNYTRNGSFRSTPTTMSPTRKVTACRCSRSTRTATSPLSVMTA